MNIKVGKKFILGEQPSGNSQSNKGGAALSNRGLQSPMSKVDIQDLPSYRQPPNDPITSMPVRDQINKLESILNEFENDLKQSKQDMENVRKGLINIPKNYNQEWDSMLEEYSNKIKQTGDRIYVIQQQENEMMDAQVAQVISLRNQYDESVQFAKNLELRSNVLEHDVGFKIVYKF